MGKARKIKPPMLRRAVKVTVQLATAHKRRMVRHRPPSRAS